jgi:hypothetical protein
MGSYKDKIITFPLFNTCYPQNLAGNLAKILNIFFVHSEVLRKQSKRAEPIQKHKRKHYLKGTFWRIKKNATLVINYL